MPFIWVEVSLLETSFSRLWNLLTTWNLFHYIEMKTLMRMFMLLWHEGVNVNMNVEGNVDEQELAEVVQYAHIK